MEKLNIIIPSPTKLLIILIILSCSPSPIGKQEEILSDDEKKYLNFQKEVQNKALKTINFTLEVEKKLSIAKKKLEENSIKLANQYLKSTKELESAAENAENRANQALLNTKKIFDKINQNSTYSEKDGRKDLKAEIQKAAEASIEATITVLNAIETINFKGKEKTAAQNAINKTKNILKIANHDEQNISDKVTKEAQEAVQLTKKLLQKKSKIIKSENKKIKTISDVKTIRDILIHKFNKAINITIKIANSAVNTVNATVNSIKAALDTEDSIKIREEKRQNEENKSADKLF